MKANVVFFGEFSEANDIILAAIGEVDSRTHDLKNPRKLETPGEK